MSAPQDPLLNLREQFRRAAAREIEREARWPWWRRLSALRAIAIILVVGGGSAGVATAVNLIATGEDRPDVEGKPRRYQSPQTGSKIVVFADDPRRDLPWGVAIYTSSTGLDCVLAGQARGPDLGIVEDGRFRPYATGTAGPCRKSDRTALVSAIDELDGRTLVYGLARAGIDEVTATHDGRTYRAQTGEGGAFLFVFAAGLEPSEITLSPAAKS